MPRVSSIFFNHEEMRKIKERVEALKYPSIYGYIKDLVLKDIKKLSQ